MLNELLKKVNRLAAGIKAKRAQLEACGGDLLEKELQLEKIEIMAEADGFESRFLIEAQKLREEIKFLSHGKSEEEANLADAERRLEGETIAACEYIRKNRIALSDVANAEDKIIEEITIAEDEDRIISALIIAEEKASAALNEYNRRLTLTADAGHDARLMQLKNEYNAAKNAASDFDAWAAKATEAQRFAMRDKEFDITGRLVRAISDYEALLDEYGLTNIYHNIDAAQTELVAASRRLEQAKKDADSLPLIVPVTPVKKGGGIVMSALLSHKHFGSGEKADETGEPEPQYSGAQHFDEYYGIHNHANYVAGAEEVYRVRENPKQNIEDLYTLRGEVYRTAEDGGHGQLGLEQEIDYFKQEARDEMKEILKELHAVRSEATQAKRDSQRAKADALLIHRAKQLAAQRIKKEILSERRREQLRAIEAFIKANTGGKPPSGNGDPPQAH